MGCNFQYFQAGEAAQLGNSSANLIFTAHGGGSRFMNDNGRPFVPICPVHATIVGGQTVYSPLAVASGIAHPSLCLLQAEESRQASINMLNGVVLGSQLTTPYEDEAAFYIARKTIDNPAMLNRFLDLYNKVYQFWLTANPAWAATAYNNAINDLIGHIVREADKSLYLTNGIYDYDGASAFMVDFAALKALDANFDAIMAVELYV